MTDDHLSPAELAQLHRSHRDSLERDAQRYDRLPPIWAGVAFWVALIVIAGLVTGCGEFHVRRSQARAMSDCVYAHLNQSGTFYVDLPPGGYSRAELTEIALACVDEVAPE